MSIVRPNTPTATLRCDEVSSPTCLVEFNPMFDIVGWAADYDAMDIGSKVALAYRNGWRTLDDDDDLWDTCPSCWEDLRASADDIDPEDPWGGSIGDITESTAHGMMTAWGYATRVDYSDRDPVATTYAAKQPSFRGSLTVRV